MLAASEPIERGTGVVRCLFFELCFGPHRLLSGYRIKQSLLCPLAHASISIILYRGLDSTGRQLVRALHYERRDRSQAAFSIGEKRTLGGFCPGSCSRNAPVQGSDRFACKQAPTRLGCANVTVSGCAIPGRASRDMKQGAFAVAGHRFAVGGGECFFALCREQSGRCSRSFLPGWRCW